MCLSIYINLVCAKLHHGSINKLSHPKKQHVLLDWSDDQCIKLLKNCLKALPSHGKVVVVDFIVPLKPDPSASTRCISEFDTAMMTFTPEGKVRSEFEFRALATAAGFRGIRAQCHSGDVWVVEMFK